MQGPMALNPLQWNALTSLQLLQGRDQVDLPLLRFFFFGTEEFNSYILSLYYEFSTVPGIRVQHGYPQLCAQRAPDLVNERDGQYLHTQIQPYKTSVLYRVWSEQASLVRR